MATTVGGPAFGTDWPMMLGLTFTAALAWAAVRWESSLLAGSSCVAMGLFSAHDVFAPGIAQSHDLHAHGWAVYSLWCTVLDGSWWPRWNPYLGLGMPLLQFYAPLGYVACWPFQAMGLGAFDALKCVTVGAQVLSAVGAWAATRRLGGSHAGAAAAAMAYSFAPYHLLDLHVRLALGELVAFPILPLLAAEVVLAANGAKNAGRLAVLIVALLLSHVLVVILAAPALILLALPALRDRSRLSGFLLAGAAAAGLSAWFWLPFVVEQGATSLAEVASLRPSTVAAVGFEALQRVAWHGFQVRKQATDPMPLYAGAILIGLTMASFAGRGRLFAAIAIGYFLLGTWPFALLVDPVPGWNRMQFGFRMWGPATAFAVLAIGRSFPTPDEGKSATAGPTFAPRASHWLLGATLLALEWDAKPYLTAPVRIPAVELDELWTGLADTRAMSTISSGLVRTEDVLYPPTDYARRVARTRVVFPEFLTPPLRDLIGRMSRTPTIGVSRALGVGVRIDERGRKISMEPGTFSHRRIDGTWLRVDWMVAQVADGYAVDVAGKAGPIRVVEAWFPGWRVRFDGGKWTDAGADSGLLTTNLPAGTQRVEFQFSNWHPWDRAVGNGVSLTTLAGLTLFGIFRAVKARSGALR